MDFEQPISVQWLADFIAAEVHGDIGLMATGINEIHKVRAGDVTFVDVAKYYKKCLNSQATIIIIDQEVPVPEGKAILVVERPFDAYNSITKRFRSFVPSSNAISEDVIIGDNTVIQPGVVVGNNCRIGRDCIIHANVTIYDHTVIGDSVIIHSGAVIGSEAFYYKTKADREEIYDKMHSCGRVVIQDGVEIGANTTIDKGVSGDTIIGRGTKIDNLVHIGHGVEIGANCLIAAQVGIAGKTLLEDGVILWGQVGVNKDLTIGKGAIVYAQSGVPSSIEGGKTYFGSPVGEAKKKMKEMAYIKKMIDIMNKK